MALIPAFSKLSRQQVILYVIVAVLAVVFLGILFYLQALRGREALPAEIPTPTAVEGLRPGVAAREFEVKILEDPRYQVLDRGLFDAGRLPVPAPAARGKPNLF